MRRASIVTAMAIVAIFGVGSPALALDQLVVTEPNHVVGYLPLYVAQRRGFFGQEGIEVKLATIENGSAPTNAILTGQAFAMLGGPEHDAYAKIKGAELRAVAGVLNRSSVYVMAAKGQEPAKRPQHAAEWASYFKGKRIGTGAYGSTPNSVTRYLLTRLGLNPQSDVQLLEIPSAAIVAAIKAGQVQLGVVNEPLVSQGIHNGIWGEPVYNVPAELGPYAWATVNVRADTIEKRPELLGRLVRGLIRGLKATYSDPAVSGAVAREEFPSVPAEVLAGAVQRCLTDRVWSTDGSVDQAAWKTAENAVRSAGVLKQDVPYADLFDMRFVKP